MKLDEDLAEVIGIIIGDGCISEYKPKAKSKSCLVLLITGSWETDVDYYKTIVQPTIKRNFGITGRLYHRTDDNTINYWITKRSIVSQFVEFGLPIGPKINKVRIPSKIIQDKRLAIACVRGIFNTDGCVFRRYSRQYKNHNRFYSHYAVVEFKIKSEGLLNQIKNILTAIEIKTTAITKDKTGASVLRVTSQEDIKKFMKAVKPRKYHLDRYNEIIMGS